MMKRRRQGSALARMGILEATRRILEPLAGAAARQGISAEVFAAVARESFAASTTGRKARRSRSDTGSTRRVDYDTALRLAGRWLRDRPYVANGRPRALPVQGRGSFAELAARAGGDPEELLANLMRVGAVRLDRHGRVVLTEEGYVPTSGVTEKLEILGRDGAEFVGTVLHNVRCHQGRARLQRRASYDNIGSAAVQSLQRHLRTLATDSLRKANTALARVDRDRNPRASGGSRTRVSFGVYVAEERVAGAKDEGRAKRPSRRRSKRGER